MNQDIWRYLDLTKFIDLLQSRTLKLARADLLADPFEGTINQYTHQSFVNQITSDELSKNKDEFKEAGMLMNGHFVIVAADFKKEDVGKVLNNALCCIKNHTFISCWHINNHESEAMWKLYSKNNQESVVIKSTISKIKNAAGHKFTCEPVNYIDYTSETLIPNYFQAPFLHKRISFQHEQEFRIVQQKLPLLERQDNHKDLDINAKGLTEVIELEFGDEIESIIDEIRISPFAPKWFIEIVKKIMVTYNFNVPIKESEIAVDAFTIES